MTDARFTSIGDPRQQNGSYLLKIELTAVVQIRFGRFFGGQAIELRPGSYLYVGSAMSGLAPRLLRHASRVDPHRPHSIRQAMLNSFGAMGLSANPTPPARKRLHWHIDYLLDNLDAALTHVYLIRSAARREEAIAALLNADPAATPVRHGLGASDATGAHLLRVDADGRWWAQLPARLDALL